MWRQFIFAMGSLFICALTLAQSRPLSPVVITLTVISAQRAADILGAVYPHDRISLDRSANALIVSAPPADVEGMRTIIAGVDVKSPSAVMVEAQQLRNTAPRPVIDRLRLLFPRARFIEAPHKTIIVAAIPSALSEINTLLTTVDAPETTPTPSATPGTTQAVRTTQRPAKDVARAVAGAVPGIRVRVSGSSIILSGSNDGITHAEELVAQLDQPQDGSFTAVYRLRSIDAQSVADLLSRSFHGISVEVDKDLNAISVLANATIHKRISDAIAQLDTARLTGSAPNSSAAIDEPVGTNSEVINLHAATPGLNGSPSTSASDIAATLTQALAASAPDLKVTVPANTTELVLTGSPYSMKLAKDLINQLDVAQPLVVLDTEILEVDETDAKNLGLQLVQPLVGTTFTEIAPAVPADGGTPPPLLSLQPFSRTPLSVSVQLNLLVQKGSARILADPRITTISGRTATIRAGDTLNILTTTGGGTGTVASTQVQSFQTGITLDITPVVNAADFVTVNLHPTVNSLSGLLNGIPQISTRDTQTTVGLQADQTLIIGGLIEDSINRTDNRIPVLGDIPLVGKLFRNDSLNRQRNELVITVTPHIVKPGQLSVQPGPAFLTMPSPPALPTLPPNAQLPKPSGHPSTNGPRQVSPSNQPPIAAVLPSPAATRSTATASTTAHPQATPTAFAQTNVFTYGQAPPNNFAEPSAPAKIFYAQVSPTVLKDGQTVVISAITTTNVSKLAFGFNAYSGQTQLTQISPGQWQGTFPFSSAGMTVVASGSVNMTLTASTDLGGVSTVPVPITLLH